jgi:hypothetical protein
MAFPRAAVTAADATPATAMAILLGRDPEPSSRPALEVSFVHVGTDFPPLPTTFQGPTGCRRRRRSYEAYQHARPFYDGEGMGGS